jgi:hypothetical protein
MDAVAGTVHVATPNALKAHQDIAADLRSDFFYVLGKLGYRFGLQAADWTEGPLILRPRLRRDKLRLISGFGYSAREAFQVGFGATALGIAAADKPDAEFVCHIMVQDATLHA